GSAAARATSLTGGIASFWPRPAGRSGWQTTPTTSCASSNRRSVGTAKSGVPKKTTRSLISDVHRRLAVVERHAFADPLLQAAAVEIALEAADAVYEQLAVEVIDLVLQRDREEVLGVD